MVRTADTEGSAASAEPLLLDDALPVCDASIAAHTIVRSATSVAYEAARSLDFLQVRTPLATAAMWARGVPARLSGRAPAAPPRLVLGEGDELPGWTVLGEVPGRELAFGAVGRFWHPSIEWRDVAAPGFAAFDEPGWGKIAASFHVAPYGQHASILTYECRTLTTDDEARRAFLRYWRLVRPFVGHILRATVDTIRSHVEATSNGGHGGD